MPVLQLSLLTSRYPPHTYHAPQLPMNHGMRIRGAAGPVQDMRIRGAAGREQSHAQLSDARPQDQVPYDPAKPSLPSESLSRSSARARSSSISKQQTLVSKPTNHNLIMERKEQQITEQQKFINRLTSENQVLSADVEGLKGANSRLSRLLEERKEQLQHMPHQDPELSRRRNEFMADQSKTLRSSVLYVKDLVSQIHKLGEIPVPPPGDGVVCPHSTQDLQGIEESDHRVDCEDDLDALDFFDFLGSGVATPVERRIQALGATMEENDWMESQQPVVVSRHLRNTKDSDKGSWYRPIDQTRYWPKASEDPAFAEIGDGPAISFKVLHKRLQDLAHSR